jgi:hypothetical protein
MFASLSGDEFNDDALPMATGYPALEVLEDAWTRNPEDGQKTFSLPTETRVHSATTRETRDRTSPILSVIPITEAPPSLRDNTAT